MLEPASVAASALVDVAFRLGQLLCLLRIIVVDAGTTGVTGVIERLLIIAQVVYPCAKSFASVRVEGASSGAFGRRIIILAAGRGIRRRTAVISGLLATMVPDVSLPTMSHETNIRPRLARF